ncbi:protein SULFUR DEFICIENCY-INDUCED 1-like [Rhododendron vialii]|uniref:protein SULFUR DEFICIENCY-INDUCED 1-like n=1 Tax=Rhododendron vialii TaxID=182163 RepID=UPI00265F0155|nr:protein SULFUR DEFICIENCY-INDUCED 1-like [Rhododendron vialii]
MEGSSDKRLGKMEKDMFHIIHKVPSGDGPFVKAKQAQLVEKDLEGAVVWFWKAINEGDRVDSALKDMAVVMKQLDRADEAIEAIKSFRGRCSKQAQNSLDNVLLDLYKKSGEVDEQIALLKHKLRLIYEGEAFNGKPTKKARSHGKKFDVSIKQETSRLLGNLGWAYIQKTNYMAAEMVYKKAQAIDPDTNKACNLALCLIKQARFDDACSVLEDVLQGRLPGSDDPRSRTRAEELLSEMGSRWRPPLLPDGPVLDMDTDLVDGLERLMNDD